MPSLPVISGGEAVLVPCNALALQSFDSEVVTLSYAKGLKVVLCLIIVKSKQVL